MVDWRDHIIADPAICHGKLCFKGTRILVSTVLDELAGGMSVERLHEEYPTLPGEAVAAALAYAAELTRERVVNVPA